MTAVESLIISRLRDKMGDNSTINVVSADVGTTIYLYDSSLGYYTQKVAVSGDVGKPKLDTSKYIWTEEELLGVVNSAFVQLFGGKKNSLDNLSNVEREIVILRATIDLHFVLATNSARYVKYKIRDVNVEKQSPNGFLEVAKALEKRLNSMIADLGNETGDVNVSIIQSTLRRYDQVDDIVYPSAYESKPTIPNFTLSMNGSSVNIHIDYAFVSDYNKHFIKKMTGTETILKTLYVLKEEDIIDSSPVAATLNTYRLYVETVNGSLFYSEKSISVP